MKKQKQSGFVNLTTLFMLAVVLAGLGFMYYKGYRLNVATHSGVGPAGNGQQDGMFYTVQVSVTPVESKAIELSNALEQDGYDAYYDTYDTGHGRQYKVRVGQYEDHQSAKAVMQQVRQRYRQFRDSFVSRTASN